MTDFDPVNRPNLKDIIQSDDFINFITSYKHSSQQIENLRKEHGLFKFGLAPFDTGDLTIAAFTIDDENTYIGEVKLGTLEKHGRGVYINDTIFSKFITEAWWMNGKPIGRKIDANG